MKTWLIHQHSYVMPCSCSLAVSGLAVHCLKSGTLRMSWTRVGNQSAVVSTTNRIHSLPVSSEMMSMRFSKFWMILPPCLPSSPEIPSLPPLEHQGDDSGESNDLAFRGFISKSWLSNGFLAKSRKPTTPNMSKVCSMKCYSGSVIHDHKRICNVSH